MTKMVHPPTFREDLPEEEEIRIGQWYWEDGSLVCVTKVGSNFVQLSNPIDKGYTRVLTSKFELVRETNPDAVIYRKTAEAKIAVEEAIGEIRALTANLRTDAAQADSQALAISCEGDAESYKSALTKALGKDLPTLQGKVRKASELLTAWMGARAFPIQAEILSLESVKGSLQARIHAVELYTGIVEEIHEVRGGLTASTQDKIHLFQDRRYMDEECLLRYEAGGMSFDDVEAFDKWLGRPENFNRIFPHPKCLVSFQVRRYQHKGASLDTFIQMFGDPDKKTFLYIRNGERLYRVQTTTNFGPKLFPDWEETMLSEPLVGSFFPKDLMTAKRHQELQDDPKTSEWTRRELDRYEPVDPETNTYFDDLMAILKTRQDEFNRVVIVLQGLFDRSTVFQPHGPVKLWEDGFEKIIQLIFDSTRVLALDPPDFAAYRAAMRPIRKGDMVCGHREFWVEREYERERQRYSPRREWWRPDWRDSPPTVVCVEVVSKSKGTARITWQREKKDGSGMMTDVLNVPLDRLFNISSYRPGSFLPFFEDSRTRAEYLQWAPLLLTAEDFLRKGAI